MKKLIFSAFAFLAIFGLACVSPEPNPAATASDDMTLASYFAPHEAGVQNGGVKVIPIETPKGKFNVWTKDKVTSAEWRPRRHARIF
jgi:proline iminopeptidase